MSATTPVSHVARPPYRPALDGLRAVAVIGVLIFHLNPKWLPGGWFGVDLFFVLSGFLITTLILREQNRTGRINFPAFWLARMRRLLPALITVLFAVVLTGWFLTIDARRESVAYDVLAALGYVANWRFVFGDEGYFSQLLQPSPLRHTWSLSIEEQFYVAFPLLMGLLGYLTTKRIIHAAVLGGIALASATWMFILFDPGADPVRVYFGTDTRAFELLIGAVGAIVFRRQSFEGFTTKRWLVQALGWLGIVLVVFGMVVLPENSPLPYLGGLVFLCIASLGAIIAAASSPESMFSRTFGLAPFRWVGLISYPLYLWHWPVIIFLDPQFTGLKGIPLAVAQAVVSVLLAWATYKFIEGPIRGRRTLIKGAPTPSRLIVVSAIPVLIITTFIFANSEQVGYRAEPFVGNAEVEAMDVAASRRYSALVFGNSIPESLARSVQMDAHPYLHLYSNTYIGCEPFEGTKIVDDKESLPSPACLNWRKEWPSIVAQSKPDVLVYFVSQTLVNDIKISGKIVRFGTAAHDAFIQNSLDHVMDTALESSAGEFALSNLACHSIPAFDDVELNRVNDISNVQHVNEVVTQWAASRDVLVIDTFTALCPGGQFSPTLNGVELYGDGLHFTSESGPIFWSWMAPQLIAHLETRD